jgi:creatinine amidohydrolase
MRVRTRFFDVLTNREVEEHLSRSDIIFLPVGTAEMHGEMPVGCEHVLPLAFCLKMAEEVDGLVLPGLHYFYAGATAIGRGTVQVSPSIGAAYLRAICHSLLRQGFRRQVLVSAHGPAYVTAAPVVREFFDETKCPIVYLDLERPLSRYSAWEEFNKLLWGAYLLLGRLEEIPLDQQPGEGRTYSLSFLKWPLQYGGYYLEASDHGWWPERRLTQEERLARAEEGARMIAAVVRELDAKAMVEGMKRMDAHIQREVLPRHRDILP